MRSFEQFYERYEAGVLAYLQRRVREPEVAADLMSETFAAALVHWDDGSPKPGGDAAWVFAIARSKLIDSWRRGRVQDESRAALGMQRVLLEDPELARIEELDDSPLMDLLATLPAEQRAAIEARVFDELDYAEIGRRLRCSSQVARKRVSRGLALLRERSTRKEDA